MITKKVKVTSLEFIFDEENQGYSVRYKYDHNYKHAYIDGDSARLVARCLTREANKFWSHMDAAYSEMMKDEK